MLNKTSTDAVNEWHSGVLLSAITQLMSKPKADKAIEELLLRRVVEKPYYTEWDFPSEIGGIGSLSEKGLLNYDCLLYTSPSPRDRTRSRMPSSA